MHFAALSGQGTGRAVGDGMGWDGLAEERARCLRAVAGNKSHGETPVRLIP